MRTRFIVIGAVIVGAGGVATPATAAPTTVRVSVSSAAAQGDARSGGGALAVSADGRFVAFVSSASNLVPGDGNGVADVFVRDAVAGTTERVSVSSGEAEADDGSTAAALALSPNGRYVTFTSDATNLASGNDDSLCAPERCSDVYIRDRRSGTTRMLVSVDQGAPAHLALSSGATFFAYDDALIQVVTRCRRSTGGCRTASVLPPDITVDEADPNVALGGMSAGGRYVLFRKLGVDTSHHPPSGLAGGVFIRDMARGRTHVVTRHVRDSADAISADGVMSLFTSAARHLIRHDTNGTRDVFVRNRTTGAIHRVSVSSGEHQGNRGSRGIAISADGRYCLFESGATNLVSGDTNGRIDLFLRDRALGVTIRVDVAAAGAQANGDLEAAALSLDGRAAVFTSHATNLVAGDTNGVRDVFMRSPLH